MPVNITNGIVYSDHMQSHDHINSISSTFQYNNVEERIAKLEQQLKETNEKLDKIIALENLWPTKND